METKQSLCYCVTVIYTILVQNCWLSKKILNNHLTKSLHASSLVISKLSSYFCHYLQKDKKRQKQLADILKTFLCSTNKLMKYVWKSCTCQKDIHI